jgi:hypothetical protein
MSKTNTVLFGSYTNKNTNAPAAPALMAETGMLNEINRIRSGLNLRAARNVYPWWAYTLAALTYFPKGHYSSMIDIDAFLTDAEVVVRNIVKHSTLLNNSIEGQGPCKIRREYTGKLPKLVRLLKLKSQRMDNFYGKGRKPIGFSFVDPVQARQLLLEQYPDTIHLFNQMDYVKG